MKFMLCSACSFVNSLIPKLLKSQTECLDSTEQFFSTTQCRFSAINKITSKTKPSKAVHEESLGKSRPSLSSEPIKKSFSIYSADLIDF